MPKKVVTNDPETVWRSTPAVIDAEWPSEMRSYFMTNYVDRWSKNEKSRNEYARIYGEEKLYFVDQYGICEENIHADQVAGTVANPPSDDDRVILGSTRKAYRGSVVDIADDLLYCIREKLRDLDHLVGLLQEFKIGD